jgi:hypothetical protein
MANEAHRNGYTTIRELQDFKVSHRQSFAVPKLIVKVTKTSLFSHHMRNANVEFEIFGVSDYFVTYIASSKATNRNQLIPCFNLFARKLL